MAGWIKHGARVLVLAAICQGEPTTAALSGVVRDPAGAPIAFAQLELRQDATGVTSVRTTLEDGSFHFLAVPAGAYQLRASKDAFAPWQRSGLVLRAGDRIAQEVMLSLGDVSQTVEVTGAAPLLQAGRGTVSFAVDQRKATMLPLDGRNFVPLLALSPGVSLPPGSVLPRINGGRPRVSEYLYDGISVLQPEPGQVAYYPVIDAIEEFRVETNSYPAEYGRANGGVIVVNQKSGTNELHGTLFEFFRNEKLNARNLFSPGGAKPRFRRNQYGLVLGGPIQRNKTFFFGDWQGTRLDTGVPRISTVPTSGARQGTFDAVFDPATTERTEGIYRRAPFPNAVIPRSRFDNAAATLLPRYPSPNVLGADGREAIANNYRRTGREATLADQFDGRLDRYQGAKHRLFARYSWLKEGVNPATPLLDGSGSIAAGAVAHTRTRAASVASEYSWTMAPAVVHQLRLGYTRRRSDRDALRTGRPGELTRIPGIPTTVFNDVLPTFDIVGLQQLGPPANSNGRFATSVTQLVDTLAWAKGRHTLKLGADIRRETLDVLQPASPTGNFQFSNIFTAGLAPSGAVTPATGNSFASFLLGQTGRFSADVQPETLQPRAWIGEFFVQDDWMATRRLTLSGGLRYTLNFPSTVRGNRGAVFNLQTQQLDLLGRNGFPRAARHLEKANFGPRAGVAYKLSESLALRAGYGLTWIEQAGITTPFTTPLFPFVQTLGQQSLDNIYPAFVLAQGPTVKPRPPGPDAGVGQGVFAVQRDNGSGYAQQWNFTLQKTYGQNWSVELGYLGSKLTRLGVPDVNLNQLTVEQLSGGALLTQQVANPFFGLVPADTPLGAPVIARGQLLRPYPRFTSVALYRNNVGHSTYHSLQSRVDKRFSRGLTFILSYTFSRLIDDAGAVFDSALQAGPVANFQAADSFNKKLEKDVSTGNIPHILAGGLVYEMPRKAGGGLRGWLGGWQMAGTWRVQSGSPLAVTQATNLNAFAGLGVQRPNRVASPGLGAGERSVSRWFDAAAFTAAPQFTIGNSSRNPVAGPGYRAADVMLGKLFSLTERVRAELRAEAFNVTNTPPLGNPNTSFGNPAFGTISTALDPRVVELVLKLRF